jgi:hypothetical protein
MFLVIRGWFSFLLLVLPTALFGYSIVYVHLGEKLPPYVSCATHQARLFNESADIIVIANKHAIDANNDELFQNDGVSFISCESLKESAEHTLFKQKSKLSHGFWRKCTERFFLLDEFMQQNGLKDVFHLEYDNMLYANLEDLLPVFDKYPHMAAVFDNDDRCIPSFVYFAHKDAAKGLASYISQNAHRGLNDMQIIARYKKENNDAIGNLPIITPAYLETHELRSSSGHVTTCPDNYSNNFEAFNSIFDAAAIGQFLGGIDPRNGISKPGFINESCLFNPALLTFEWKPDEHERKIPYACFEKAKARINNLHVHSKNLKAFAS